MNGYHAAQWSPEAERLENKSENNAITVRIASLGEGLTCQAISKVVHQTVRDCPRVANDKAFWLAPESWRRSIRKPADQRRSVALVVGASEQIMIIVQLVIESGDVGVLFDWKVGVESESSRVQPVAYRGVVHRVTAGGGGQNRQPCRICARINAIGGEVSGADLWPVQAVHSRRSACRTRTEFVRCAASSKVTNDALAERR